MSLPSICRAQFDRLCLLAVLAACAGNLGNPTSARASSQTRCDDTIWLCGSASTSLLGPGTAAAGENPALSNVGLIWLRSGGLLTEMLRGRPTGEDALGISYQIGDQTQSLANTRLAADLETSFAGGEGNQVRYLGSNGQLQLNVKYLLPVVAADTGVVLITTRVTNISDVPISNLRISRSLNPHFQVDATNFSDALGMARLGAGAVAASLPVVATASAGSAVDGATLLLGSLDPGVISSVEGDLVTDPLDILLSPRDPAGAVEDTSLAMARDFGTLLPGESATLNLVLVAASDPVRAMQVLEQVPVPATVWLALEGAAMLSGLRLVRKRRRA